MQLLALAAEHHAGDHFDPAGVRPVVHRRSTHGKADRQNAARWAESPATLRGSRPGDDIRRALPISRSSREQTGSRGRRRQGARHHQGQGRRDHGALLRRKRNHRVRAEARREGHDLRLRQLRDSHPSRTRGQESADRQGHHPQGVHRAGVSCGSGPKGSGEPEASRFASERGPLESVGRHHRPPAPSRASAGSSCR